MKNDDSFSKQIDDVLSGKYNRFDALKVCDTPRIFLDAGLQQLPILYTQNHLKDALHEKSADNPHWHGLSIEQIKKVPKLLESPVLLMDSLNNDDSIVAVLSLLDNDNAPVFATIKPNGNGIYNSHKTDSNFMLSIYGKEKGFEYYIKRAAEENKILYWNKEKSQEIQCAELLMAQGLDSLDSNKILHQTNSLVNKTTSTLVIDSNQAARIKAAREIKENMPNLSENERAAAIAILEAGAKSQRMSISEYMEKTFPDGIFGDIKKAENSAKQQGIEINGAVSINGFGENAKAVIYASKTADFSTWCHELSHIWQSQLTGELKQNAEEAFQVKNSDWQNSIYTFEDGHADTSAEAFAYGFEDFLKHKAGEMATEDKKVIFEKFADYMSRTYNGVKQNIKINEKIAKVYEKFLQLDDNILAEAEKAVRLEIEQEQKINKIFNSPNLKTSQKVSETIGLVSDKFADLASRYGYDIKGYSHTIDNFFVSHALKQHGNKEAEEKRGNIAITHSDICNVFSVYTHPDYIIFGTKTKTGNHAIVYVKNIGDSTIFVEDVRSGKKELAAQTLYKKSGTIDVSSKKEAPELYAHSDPESVFIVDVKKEFVNEIENAFLQREKNIQHSEKRQDYIRKYYTNIKNQYYETEQISSDGKRKGIIEVSNDRNLNSKTTRTEIDALLAFTDMGAYATLLSESLKIGDEKHIDALLNHRTLVEIKSPTGNANSIAKEIKEAINKENSELVTVFLLDSAKNVSDDEILEKLEQKRKFIHGKTDGIFVIRNGILSEIKIPRVESFQTRSHSNSNNITDAKNVNISFQPVDSSMLFQSAYHGSSANFEKFNTSEYGMSGDGAMAFGYGVYVSNSETIARSYAGIQGERNLYAVEIPDGDYIVWDKKISNSQKEKVKNELYENLIKEDYKGVEKQISAELDNVFSEELDGKNLYGTVSSYIGSDKETSRFFKNIGYSGIQYPAGTPENAINYVIFDDNDITIKEHFQFQIIGELGARELDRNAESNERIENLETAKKMEETKKDAKAIRLATGWEKGADGKWKYEIDDSKVHFNLYDAMEEWDERHPRYEELREKFFKTGLSEEEQKEFDQWIDERNEVSDKHTDMDFSEKLFGKTFKLPEVMRHNELFKAYPELKNVTVSIQRTGESGTLGNASYEAKHINLYRHEKDIGSFEEWEKKAGSVLLHEVQHIIQGTEGFAKGASPEMFEESPESSEQSNALDGKIVAGGKTFTSAMEAYRASAGEVESRNVQARMRFTPEQRINTLLSDTADIAPQDQIVMFDGPTSESRDIENTNEEHTVALKADSQENKMENTSSENISYENEEYWKTQFLNDNAETFKALDDFLNDGVKPKNDEFIFSKVPEILKASNVSENEIVIKTSIINKAKNEHNLSEQEIKDSIKNIASPVLIFDSDKNTTENKKNSFLSLTDTFAENGKPVAFSMNLDSEYERKNRFLKVNEIRSIHDRTLIAKNGTDLIQKWTKSGLCRYVDDKKISEWSKAAGVQFPLAVLQSDNFRIQQEDGFVNEILSFSKFADQQKNMEIEYQEYLKTVSPDFEEFWEEQTDTNVQNIESSKTEFSNYDSQEYQQKKLTTQMILDQEDREQMEAISATMKSATKDVMDLNATPITEIPFTKENYDKLFPFGIVQTPVEKVKLGEHQFEKLDEKDRGRFLLASYQTLATPDIVIEEVKEGKVSHNYIKSFVFDEKTKTIQDIVVNIDGENISISAHPRNVNNVLNKIKTPDQLVYAAAEVGRMIEQRVQNELEIVNPTRADRLSTISVPLNKEYSMENALSTINVMENSGSVKQEENPFKNADPEQIKELYEQAEAVEKMQQEAAYNAAVLDENSNPQYQTDEEFLQEYKQKYPESSLSISEDTKNELENVFSQIDDYLDKGIVPEERRFTLPGTPLYLKELGSNETAISLPVSVIKKAKETHGLSNEEIKNSLTRLYDPVAVFDTDKTKSENKLDSKLILTDEFSESKPIALALNTNTQIQVQENGHRKFIEVQDIRSIHDRTLTAKNGTDLVKQWSENGLCRYVDDKKISEWSTVARVYFPIEALHSDKNNILTKSEVVNPQNSSSVKQEENSSLQMEPGLIKKFNEMKKAIESREKQESQTAAEKTESAGSRKAENHEKPKVDLIKKAAKDFISAIKNGTAPFLNSTEKDFGKISLRPAAIVNASNGLPFSGEAQLLAQIYYQQQKMEGEIVTTFEGAKESGTFIANKPESKKNFVLANKTEQQQKEIIQKTRYFMPEACDEPDKIYAHALQKQRPQKISDYRDLIRHFENIPNGQKEISDLRIRIAHEHLKEIQSRFAMKKERILTVDEINERKKILQDYFKNLPEKHRESEKNAFENTFGLTLNPEETFKTNLEGNFKNKKFEDVVKSNEKLTDQANRKLSSFIQKNSMEDKKLSEILHEEYNAQSKEEKETSKKLKIEAIGISEPETYLGKYLAACNANAEFVTDENTIKAVQSNLVKKLEENYRVEKYGILKEIGQQAQRISNETTSKIAFDKAHSNKNTKEKKIEKEIGPIGMGN